MITIATSSSFINSVVNDPWVHRLVCPNREGEIEDLSALVYSDEHLVVEADPHGGFALAKTSPDSYVIHTMFHRYTPSRIVMQAATEGLWLMFVSLDAMELTSSACQSNVPALKLMHNCGFVKKFERESRYSEGKMEEFYSLSIHDYIMRNDTFREKGEAFHELVADDTNHGYDPTHDNYVGAAIAMFECGNVDKALMVYNKWAIWSGYCPATLDGNEVKVGNMIITVSDDMKLEAVRCQ